MGSSECGPISPSTVHRILAHICPLEDALPQNLISRPLLQRHHFLGLTPEDAAEYVGWSSLARGSLQSHVLDLLRGQTPSPNVGEHLSVRYTADTEDFLSHVCISPHLRLVFLWENKTGWQYHDLTTMPFPPSSLDNFNDAYLLHSPNDFLPEQDYPSTGDDDDDSYWNSYRQQDHAPHLSVSKVPEDTTNPEDAYWARYSTIQGSADSTIPSPLPPTKNPKSELVINGLTDLQQYPERVVVPPTEFQVLHVEPYNPLEPPSPAAISRRLQELLYEPVPLASPLTDEPESDSETPSSHHTEIDAAPPNLSATQSQISPDEHDPFQTAMQDTIKNLYKLWRVGRQDRSIEQDKDVFINAVQRALEEL